MLNGKIIFNLLLGTKLRCISQSPQISHIGPYVDKIYTYTGYRGWGYYITLKECKGTYQISNFELADELARVLYE